MKRNKVWTRALTLLLAAVLAALAIPEAWATETAPTLTVSNIMVSQGGTGYVDVYGANLDSLAALEFTLTYDPQVLSVSLVSAYAMDSKSVNKDTPGIISFKGMHVSGVSGSSVRFMQISFRTAADAEPGSYPIDLTVGFAKKTDYSDVVFEKQAGSVTVTKAQPSRASFYAELSADSVEVGSKVEYRLKSYNSAKMAAGQFSFTYDSDQMEFLGAKLLSGLQTEGCEYSVNHSNPGLVVVAWLSKTPAASGSLLELTFRATNTGNGTITCTPGTLVDTENNSITAAATPKTVTITQKEEEAALPAFWLELPDIMQTNKPFTLTAVVDGSSGLGAADFTVNYDASVLVCQSVEKADSSEEGVAVMINPNHSGGVIKFSMMCNDGISQDTELVQMTFRAKNNSAATTELKTDVRDAVDAALKTVELEALPAQLSIVVPYFTVTFLDQNGTVLKTQTVPYLGAAEAPAVGDKAPDDERHYLFNGWNRTFDKVTDDLIVTAQYTNDAHTEVTDEAIPASCTEAGKTEGKHCSVCHAVLVAQEEVPALGHKLQYINRVEATFENAGMSEHWACEACDKLFADEEAQIQCNADTITLSKRNMQVIETIDGQTMKLKVRRDERIRNTAIFFASYKENGQMIGVHLCTAQELDKMILDDGIEIALPVGAWKVFLLDEFIRPVSDMSIIEIIRAQRTQLTYSPTLR